MGGFIAEGSGRTTVWAAAGETRAIIVNGTKTILSITRLRTLLFARHLYMVTLPQLGSGPHPDAKLRCYRLQRLPNMRRIG